MTDEENKLVHHRTEFDDWRSLTIGIYMAADNNLDRAATNDINEILRAGVPENSSALILVDRARLGATRIGRGTKIDNLVQVAHNVRLGERCLVMAQAGLYGSILPAAWSLMLALRARACR